MVVGMREVEGKGNWGVGGIAEVVSDSFVDVE